MTDIRRVHYSLVVVAFLTGLAYGLGIVQAAADAAGEYEAELPVGIGRTGIRHVRDGVPR